MDDKIKRLIDLIELSENVAALTGAGISTLSGIPDFRGGYNPLWDKFPQEKVFDIDYFKKDPVLFYDFLREILKKRYHPNIAHKVLKCLEEKGKLKGIITQNIDGLHQQAGSKVVYELHGSIYKNHCVKCKNRITYDDFLNKIKKEAVPLCECGGIIRPDVVFFGELLPDYDLKMAFLLAQNSDLLLITGTSLVVQPAAYIPNYTLKNGGKVVLINRGDTYINERAVLVIPEIKEAFDLLAEYYGIQIN